MTIKSMTLRLSQEQADELELIATVAGRPISEEIREAIDQHIDSLRQDPGFQARLVAYRGRLARLT